VLDVDDFEFLLLDVQAFDHNIVIDHPNRCQVEFKIEGVYQSDIRLLLLS